MREPGDEGAGLFVVGANQQVEWGPVAGWAGAAATVLVVITTSLVALGYFERFRAPRPVLTFAPTQPWCRRGRMPDGTPALWVRVGVENQGKAPAVGCVGRLISVTTGHQVRADVDPVQLRWAGVPRSRAFDPIDLRRGQREYLNVLCWPDGATTFRLVTFDDPDFDPGFPTELSPAEGHELQLSVFAANGPTVTTTLVADAAKGAAGLSLQEP
jgi:hypothetical protein